MDTPATDRLTGMDALRGIAVLGILMMNVQGYAMSPLAYDDPTMQMDLGGANLTVWAIANLFFQLKFITLFSTLFGAGIAMMVERSGGDTARHRRRMLWLLAIGAVHAYLVWWGDVLVSYALLGLIAVKLRNLPARQQVLWGLVLIGVSAVIMVGGAWAGALLDTATGNGEQDATLTGLVTAQTGAYRSGYINSLLWNIGFALMGQIGGLITIGPRLLGLMLIGMALYKSGFLSAGWSAARYALIAAVGVGVGLVISAIGTFSMIAGGFDATAIAISSTAGYFGSLVLAMGYASAVMLAARAGGKLLKPVIDLFAATGRMAFTNYLAQSLIMTAIFVGPPGLGLFGTVERVGQLKLVLAVWAVQLIWSVLWLSVFRYGPMEWVWRSLTYGRRQPLLKRTSPEA